MKKYETEKEGQLEFLNDYLKLVDKDLSVNDVLSDYTDGIINGNILEFKLNINYTSTVLMQVIKYLSALRIKGKSIPKNILLISLNEEICYVYNSKKYLKEIEQVYIGGASKGNHTFIIGDTVKILKYRENQLDEVELIKLLKEKEYTKINIDENCIVGWAERFYKENPNANKSDFIGDLEGKVKIIGEIREPNKFKDYIYPYNGKTNIKFQYLMDKLNDNLNKKKLGAFYTPELYVEKALELVREAIKKVPKGNDYIILDRCAGTGNLEKLMTTEELSHCIISTIEYYEYKVLLEILGDKVRHIIPPTEKEDTFNMGMVKGADALSKEYIDNPVIKEYIDNPKCTIILFENPPYAETTSIEHQKKGQSKENSLWKKSYVVTEMKKEIKGRAVSDLANVFIWSAFKYYLRQPTDSYIVFSPLKYWKSQKLITKKFVKGFAFNRKFFHTNIEACISCIYWKNKEKDYSKIELEAYNIVDDKIVYEGNLAVNKMETLISAYYDKREDKNDVLEGIACELNGKENIRNNVTAIKRYNPNIIGYMVVKSTFDNPDLNSSLLISTRYDGAGTYLRKDLFLQLLPVFSVGRYIKYNSNWTERGRIMKSADMKDKYLKDLESGKLNIFLLKNLLYVCFEPQNHCRSLKGTDNRFYRNELCLDTTNGETVASEKIKELVLNEKEKELMLLWNTILSKAKETREYDSNLTYGLYQIDEELNTSYKNEKLEKIYNYPELNSNIKALKMLLKEYYLKEIVPILFEYEFLK